MELGGQQSRLVKWLAVCPQKDVGQIGRRRAERGHARQTRNPSGSGVFLSRWTIQLRGARLALDMRCDVRRDQRAAPPRLRMAGLRAPAWLPKVIECNYARKSADSVTTPCCGSRLLQSSSSSTYAIRWVQSKPTTVLRLGAEPDGALRRSTRACDGGRSPPVFITFAQRAYRGRWLPLLPHHGVALLAGCASKAAPRRRLPARCTAANYFKIPALLIKSVSGLGFPRAS